MIRAVARRAGEFWTERKAAWYRRALERGDYAEKVLGVLAALLAKCESALDVGAGCLRAFLSERLVPDRPGWVAPYKKRAAVIWWRVGGEVR